jgi:hypothetical protein
MKDLFMELLIKFLKTFCLFKLSILILLGLFIKFPNDMDQDVLVACFVGWGCGRGKQLPLHWA